MSSFSIGQNLRRERERQGVSLDDIARITRISLRFLESIEAEDFESLPGLVFTRNFVRQYAEALHMDSETIVASLPKLDETNIQLPDPPKQRRKRTHYAPPGPGIGSLLWSALAIAAGVVLYGHFNNARSDAFAKIRAAIANIHISRSQSVEAAAVVGTPKNAPHATEPPPRPVTVDESKSALPVTPPQVSARAAASTVQVVVTAVQAAWVQLSADGKTSFTGTLMPNETKAISAVEQVKIVAGNAGGLTVSLNGKPLDPLGPVGQVRVVRLTAEGPEFLEVVHPSAPEPDPL